MPDTASQPLDSTLPFIPAGKPTNDSLMAEARALGSGFVVVTAPPAAIATDADEMLGGLEDLAAFAAGSYPVTPDHFSRIQLLRAMLAPQVASRERDQVGIKRHYERAEARRDKLLALRGNIARQAHAAGLDTRLFSVGKINTERLTSVLWRVDEVLDNTRALRERFANKPLVDRLIAEASALVSEIKEERTRLGLMAQTGQDDTRLQQQIERLLVDTMRFVGAQGLACFDGDERREARYRLDHVYARSQTPDNDEPLLPPSPPADA